MIYILNFIHLISMHKRYLHSFFSLVFYFNIELLFLHHRICFCLLVLVKLSTTTKRIPTNNQPTTQQKQQRKKKLKLKKINIYFSFMNRQIEALCRRQTFSAERVCRCDNSSDGRFGVNCSTHLFDYFNYYYYYLRVSCLRYL